jgi:benzoate-CoA ligase
MSVPTPIHVPARFNAAAFFLDRHVQEGRGERVAFRFQGRAVTYEAVASRASRAGNALRAGGVEIEQRVLIALSDRPEFAEVFWGAIKIGAVAVAVNPTLRREDYAFLLNDSRARVVVADETAAEEILAARDASPWLERVVLVGTSAPSAIDYGAWLGAASPDLAPADTSADDVALWGYTSGSTGRPKAAIHLHHDLVHAAERVGIGAFGIGPDDLVFSVSKLYFTYGLGNSLYFPARVGAASLLVPERPEPERIFELIHAERPTLLFTVPTVYARLLQVPDAARRFDLSSLRLCLSSGEALPPAIFHAWHERFGRELLDVIGSTEALHDFIANRPGRARAGSSGELIAGFEARLVDGEGRPVVTGGVGELWVKGESTAPAYWNRHAETKRTMLGEWLRTGDMFYRDTDGYFFFCGRTDDMLKVGGMWVSPAEIEASLLEHPAVLEAAVVGRRDTDGLTRAHAFCVLRGGRDGSPELATELQQAVRKRLAGYKSPR